MMQQVIIWVLFAAAVIYMGRLFYRNFFSRKEGCAGNCGCSAIELEKLEKQIKKSLAEKKLGNPT